MCPWVYKSTWRDAFATMVWELLGWSSMVHNQMLIKYGEFQKWVYLPCFGSIVQRLVNKRWCDRPTGTRITDKQQLIKRTHRKWCIPDKIILSRSDSENYKVKLFSNIISTLSFDVLIIFASIEIVIKRLFPTHWLWFKSRYIIATIVSYSVKKLNGNTFH